MVTSEKQLNNALISIEKAVKMYQEYWKENESLSDLEQSIELKKNIWDRKNFHGHLTSVAIVLTKNLKEVLLIEHGFTGKFLAPGGHCDPFEKPYESATRELFEETGIEAVTIHEWHKNHEIPIDIDIHLVPERPSKNEPAHLHFDFRYIFIANQKLSLELQAEEVDSGKFCPISDLKGEYERVYRKLLAIGVNSK